MADARDLSPMLVGESPALLGDDLCIFGRRDADAKTLHQIHGSRSLADLTVDPRHPPHVDFMNKHGPAPVGLSIPNPSTRYRVHDEL
jgi:hypothetical protein